MFGFKKRQEQIVQLHKQINLLQTTKTSQDITITKLEEELQEFKNSNEECNKDYKLLLDKHTKAISDFELRIREYEYQIQATDEYRTRLLTKADKTINRLVEIINNKK